MTDTSTGAKAPNRDKKPKILISGGGTGGHVFPAIAIADAIRRHAPDADILFVGAHGKIEMDKVPQAGYAIVGLPISGFHRQLTWRNLSFPFKLAISLFKAWGIVRRFRPDVAVGVGGYASGPVLKLASRSGVPCLLQEQNSYAGVTNRLLAAKAQRICVAYEGMEQYFPAHKLVLTGNPVRQDLVSSHLTKADACGHFGFDAARPVVFVTGGSLGAKAINEAMAANATLLAQHPEVQILWQVGRLYEERFAQSELAQLPQVQVRAFIDRMDMAYAMADLVVCRAGALTISELCLMGQPAILIPSPNVAEDHQTKNARALADRQAAILLKDAAASEHIATEMLRVLQDPALLGTLSRNARALAKPQAADNIAEEVLKLIKR